MAGFMVLKVWREAGVEALDPEDINCTYLQPESHVGAEHRVAGGESDTNAWWAQYSAPGYMDRTDVVHGTTAVEAALECFAIYGNDESKEDRDELAAILWQARKVQ